MDDPIIARAFAVNDVGELKAEIKQLRLGYREIGSRKRWFVQVVQGLEPYKKPWLVTPAHSGDVGIDLGSKHVAVVVPATAHAENIRLNANVEQALKGGKAAERRRARAQDRSKRATNPDCFDEKGRFRKGKRIMVRSKGYHALGAERRELHRRANETKRQQRNALANAIIEQGQAIHYEAKLSYPGWQAAGMGTSMLSSTPGGLMTAIEKACTKYGRDTVAIDYRAAKLSQMCHECGQPHKDPIKGSIESRLSTCDCGRAPMQRDIYSALLAAHCDAAGNIDTVQAANTFDRIVNGRNDE
jgi:transposase